MKHVGSRVIQVLILSSDIQCPTRWKHYNEYVCGVQLAGKGVKFKVNKVIPVEAMKP